ncbi:hypothetical protein GDO86_009289 [Hymenochirus boettgeri]|uniref:C3H1-type domain-containing protein n=1 Tax=Hymenochirus boettgeri TaxID=247094 RepID=A0A8T2JK01_9PIPI|nr:hypothetical protein GDO86_009289 [Hymenochirus boettgeri]
MAFESLFSRPPNPVLDQNMTDSEHAGDTREDGELEDGEIDDGGIEEKTQEIQAAENPSIAKTRRKRRRRKRGKEKEKKKEKRRRREKHKQSFNSDNSSEYSCDSDTDYAERSSKETMYRDYDQVSQLDHVTLNYMNPSNAQQKKSANEYVDYGNNSDGNYNEEDEEDFAEQLKHYRQAKEHSNFCEPLNKSNYKGIHQGREQPPAGFYGRGRGIQKKDRGRGRGVHKGPKPYFQDGFQEGTKPIKKWVNLSQEFISQHTVEHKGKQICKYFLQERCYKGDQCKFHHEAEIGKWNEVCKFYVQGCCTKGDKCRYMHDEFPCKFYHTGAKCYQGDNCKFSHDPLTDESRDLLNKVLNTEEEVQHEDENGSEEMQRHGTPFYSPPFLGMQFQGSHHSMYGSDQLPECEPNVSQLTEKPLLQSDSCFANFSQTGATAPYNASSFPNHLTNNQRENISFSSPSFLQNPESKAQMMQQQNSYPSSQNTTGFFDNYYSQQAVYNAKSSSTPENDISNWYTSSEEEDGSGVTSILKTLRNQAKIARVNSTEQSLQSQTFDPRLAKDRAVRPQVSDPRVKCTQVENSKDPEETACTDPRFARTPENMKSKKYHLSSTLMQDLTVSWCTQKAR